MISSFDDDDDDDDLSDALLLLFYPEAEHAIPEDVDKALVWACSTRFLSEEEQHEFLDFSDFEAKHKSLAQAVMFHGPYTDFKKAIAEAKKKTAIVVAKPSEFTEDSGIVWLACLSN